MIIYQVVDSVRTGTNCGRFCGAWLSLVEALNRRAEELKTLRYLAGFER